MVKWVAQSFRLCVTPWAVQSMEFSRPVYWSGYPFSSPGDIPNLGIEPRSPLLQADSLPAEPQGKPKNNGVGRLSLLQQIFPTQELNQNLLHCWQILYQLRQGRPKRYIDSYFSLLTLLSHCIFNFKDCLILWGAVSHKWLIWKYSCFLWNLSKMDNSYLFNYQWYKLPGQFL